VETGVANGVSSTHMLLALHKNRQGTLHSIEIGDSTYLPAGREPGWVVPDWLRGRWKFHLGDARQILPQLARELPSLDLFTHDSLHTYEHMKFELNKLFRSFAQAASRMTPYGMTRSGILLAPRWSQTRKFFMA